ncbi:hypothetical protein Hanom_Chr09g00782621 [Helianthus anomalus]
MNPSAIHNSTSSSLSKSKSFGNKEQYANNCFKVAERSRYLNIRAQRIPPSSFNLHISLFDTSFKCSTSSFFVLNNLPGATKAKGKPPHFLTIPSAYGLSGKFQS